MGFLDRFLASSNPPPADDAAADVSIPATSSDAPVETAESTNSAESELATVKAELAALQAVHSQFVTNVTRLMPVEIHLDMRAGVPIHEAVAKFIKSRS